jgi:hypothetical protein
MLIRRYEHRDAEAVRDLFVRVNRALAPPGMREAFEGYIAIAIRDEIGRIDDYYACPRRGFGVAEDPSGAPRSAQLARTRVASVPAELYGPLRAGILGRGNRDFDATVLRPAGRGVVGRDRIGFTPPLG